MPRVSAIICVYNQPLVKDAIESVLAQTYPDYELIIIDDGSDDQTRKILSSFRDRARIFQQENQGIAQARNQGLSLAQGDLIAYLDADDLWLPEYLSRQKEFLDANPQFPLCFTDGWFIRQETIPDQIHSLKTYFSLYPVPAGEKSAENFFETPIITSLMMFRRSFFAQAGFFSRELRINEDADLLLRGLEQGMEFGFLNQPLGIKRQLSAGLSQNELELYLYARAINKMSWERSPRLKPYLRKGLPELNRTLARIYFEKGEIKNGRSSLREALRFKPWALRTFLLWLISFLPFPLSGPLLHRSLPVYKKWKSTGSEKAES